MNKYKYFHRSDLNKETVGIVKAKNEKEAFLKAANKKQLSISHFINLFAIEEIK